MARERRHRRRVREDVEQPAAEEETKPMDETEPGPTPPAEENPPASRRRSRAEASGTTDGASLLAGLLGSLEVGKAVVIRQTGENEYTVNLGDGVTATEAVVSKPAKRVSRDVFLTPEYTEWSAEWSSKTYEEKLAYAKEHKTKWDENPDAGINAMRVGMAVQEQLGIQKYKDGFESIKARRDAKALLQAGASVKGL